jgi:flagellar protein FlaG
MLKVTQATTTPREGAYAPAAEPRPAKPPVAPGPVSASSVQSADSTQVRERVAKQIEELNRFVRARDAQIQFEIDDSSARVVTKIVDMNTREVLRQIPSEEVLRMAEALSDSLATGAEAGVQLVKAKA